MGHVVLKILAGTIFARQIYAMAKVSLKGMKFYSFHGYYDFERRVGNNFILDVEADVEMVEDPAEQIENTINYEILYDICQKHMSKQYRLLESVAYDIAVAVKEASTLVTRVTVTLAKLNPPLPGKVDQSEIQISL